MLAEDEDDEDVETSAEGGKECKSENSAGEECRKDTSDADGLEDGIKQELDGETNVTCGTFNDDIVCAHGQLQLH